MEIQPAHDRPPIAEARRIIAFGRGIRSKEDIIAAEELAEKLGAVVAGSRPLVEKGWMPPSTQIGLSGHAVQPDWLLTLEISGSIQFQAGIRRVKRLIAVDSNPNAPILDQAHLPICADLYADLYQVLRSLTEVLVTETWTGPETPAAALQRACIHPFL